MRALPFTLACLMSFTSSAWAFHGVYPATSGEALETASRVILVHEDGRTVVTVASDVHGDAKQLALIIPVPTVIQPEQVRIVAPRIVEHLIEYSKPRLVEDDDPDPCGLYEEVTVADMLADAPPPAPAAAPAAAPLATNGVTIEAAFDVEEYSILVLAAKDSDGLITWLNENGHKMPADAAPVIGSYLAQHMHFFVAKVNLDRMKDKTKGFLRPIRVEYDTPKFMLPIRLGTVNASGPRDMLVLALTHTGRVDVTNYRTVHMPTGMNVPEYIQDRFGQFYDAVFDRQVAAADSSAVFLEYAWPMAVGSALCDPCSSPPLEADEFAQLGVKQNDGRLFLTRLHVRYNRAPFPEDLQFRETPDTENYQARYVMQVAWKGRDLPSCPAGVKYRTELRDRWRQENATLARLTGWNSADIRKEMVAYWDRAREN